MLGFGNWELKEAHFYIKTEPTKIETVEQEVEMEIDTCNLCGSCIFKAHE